MTIVTTRVAWHDWEMPCFCSATRNIFLGEKYDVSLEPNHCNFVYFHFTSQIVFLSWFRYFHFPQTWPSPLLIDKSLVCNFDRRGNSCPLLCNCIVTINIDRREVFHFNIYFYFISRMIFKLTYVLCTLISRRRNTYSSERDLNIPEVAVTRIRHRKNDLGKVCRFLKVAQTRIF